MSKNDLVLLEQLLTQRRAEAGEGLEDSAFFELFAAEQILKDEDLSYDELQDGIVDEGGDGGIDSVYFFVNDALYEEDTDTDALSLVRFSISTSSWITS